MKNLSSRRILLVGGAGFIGHNMALRLKELGAEVFIIDDLVHNNYHSLKDNKDFLPRVELYLKMIEQRMELLRENSIPVFEQDSRDYDEMLKIAKALNVDTLIHLAAIAHANISNKEPYKTFDNSFRTLQNSIEIARVHKDMIKHFIYLSSSMVYGNFTSGAVDEETQCNPIGIYGTLKLSGEHIVKAYNHVFGVPYTIIRPSALYGERCVSRRVGQIFIENAIEGKEIIINGDGSDRLDFTYIGDFISGVVNILESDKSKNQLFNLTYGESRSLAQMADIVKEYFQDVKITYVPKDRLTPDRGTLSVDKARTVIGYNPQFPLEKGFIEYIKWYKELYK